MKKKNFILQIFFLTIFMMNIAILTIPMQNEEFYNSDHFFLSLLKGIGYEPQDSEGYRQIPRLSRDSILDTIDQQFKSGNINFKLSEYYVPGWADTRWQFRKNITIDSTKVTSNLVNFPVLIDLYDSDLQENAQASGNDIMFTNVNGWILDHEIEYYNRVHNSTHAHLTAWVKTNLSSSQNTIISMYYGNPSATSQESATDVWISYTGIWHLSELGTGTRYDSTNNKNNGIPIDYDNDEAITGVIAGADDFDGVDDHVIISDPGIGSIYDFDTGANITISAWIRPESFPEQWNTFLTKGSTPSAFANFGCQVVDDDLDGIDGKLDFFYRDSIDTNWNEYETSADVISTSNWYHVVFVYTFGTGSSLKIFVNGVEIVGSWVSRDGNDDPLVSNAELWFGADDNAPYSSPNELFDGILDEIRLSNAYHSADWISTEYCNQYDPETFYSISTKESYNVNNWDLNSYRFRKNITIDAGKVFQDLNNFTILIDLYDSDLHDLSKVQIAGDDIVFSDLSGLKLDHEIELFNQTYNSTHAHLVAWVRVPFVSNTLDTSILMYYGNSAVSSQENPEGVWDSNYLAVHHMEESPVGTLYDSTNNNEDLITQGSMTSSDLVNASIGQGIDFDNNNDGAVSSSTISVSSFTISAWINPDTVTDDWDCVVNVGHGEGSVRWVGLSNGVFIIDDGSSYSFGSALSSDTWHHILVTYDGSTARGYVDGSFEDSYSRSWGQVIYRFQVGAFAYDASYSLTDFFDGIIDEVRITNTPRSAGWIGTEYQNQLNPDAFYSVSNEETNTNWWGDGTFTYRKDIVVDKNKVSGDLTNFPVVISIVDSSLKSGKLQPDARDLLFINNGTKLAHEIERFAQNSTHGELTAWVKIPELSSSEDTVISMYYGNSELFTQENPFTVWDDNYMGVWHLNDDPTGTIYDSTTNNNDGSSGGSMTEGDKVLAKIGEGIDFDGINDYIAFPDPLSTETMTISCWVYLDAASADWITVAMKCDGISWFDWQLYARASDGEQVNHAVFRTYYPSSTEVDSDIVLSTGTWYYLVGEHNGTHNHFFTNGTLTDSDTDSNSVQDHNEDVWIGGNEVWGEYLDGCLDEFRVSNFARSNDWISTQYNNQKDPSEFYSIGTTYTSPKVEGSSYGFVWLDTPNEVDLGTTYNSWVTQDLSNESVPAAATGVLLAWSEADAAVTSAVARGTEDLNDYMDGGSIYNEFEDKTWKMQIVKLDSETKIETYREETEDILFVMGYIMGHDPWFRPTPSDLGSLAADSSWHTITVNGVDDDTTGVILFGQSLFVNDSIVAVRSVGSTDDLTTAEWEEYHSAMIFVKIDENDQFEYYLSNAAKFYVVAEVKNSVDWLSANRVDISPKSTGWTTIDLDSYITVNPLTSGVIYQFESTDSSDHRNFPRAYGQTWTFPEPAYDIGSDTWMMVGSGIDSENRVEIFSEQGIPDLYNYIHTLTLYSSEAPPEINNFGVDDPGTGTGTFWADITDKYYNVESVEITINSTKYDMLYNGSYWRYQLPIIYKNYYTYQITNTTNSHGKSIESPSSVKNHTFNYDSVAPVVDEWEYYDDIGPYGTFKANVSDSWGVIDTVIINVTEAGGLPRNDLWAIMQLTASGYMNDTLILPSGTIKYVVTANDTANNIFTSAEHQGLVSGTNQAPSVDDVTFSRSETAILLPILSNNTLYLNYSYSDPESDPESGTEIRWYKNGVLQSAYDDVRQIPSFELIRGDEWNITIKPKDGQEFGNLVASDIVTIQNTPPQITTVSITPANPFTTQQLFVSNTTIDEDGDSLTFDIKWFNPNENLSYEGSLLINSDQTRKDETWWCEIRAWDGINYSSWTSASNITIQNSIPSASSLQVTPSGAKTTDSLTASYSFSDADNDAQVGSRIRWYKNGVLQGNLNDSLTVDSTLTLKGENWYFTVEPSDGATFGTLKTSPVLNIANTAPSVSNLEILPTTVNTTASLTGNYIFEDLDNDGEISSIIIWYKDGVLQGSLNGSSDVKSGNTTKGEEWHFKVRPSDGTDDGLWYSCSVNVTIGNSIPSVSNLAINPSSPDSTDDLSVIYDYFDIDSDPESSSKILWYMNGSLQGQLNDSVLVQSGNITKGQIWHVKVRVFDGTNFSTWMSLSTNVTIENSPPVISDIRLNGYNGPTQISNTDDLVGSYVYSDTDNDPQINVSREVYWYKKGQAESSFYLQVYLNHTLTVGSDNTSVGDIWYFVIRVFDGTSYSTSESSPSVSIGVPPNNLPEAQFLNITPSLPITTDSLYINWTFVDADLGDNESGSMYFWYRNGVVMPDYNGLQTLPAFATTKGEIWHVKVRPRDGVDFGQLVSVPINVTIGNIAPEVSNLQITPFSAITGNDLSISYIFSDIDGDGESDSEIIWYIDGILQGSLNDSISISSSSTIKGQIWHFKIRPSDGTDFGIWTSCSINVTIGNTAPSSTSLAVTPTDPKTGEDLTANYIFSDPDTIAGDVEGISLIQWFKNGIKQTIYENQTIIPFSVTLKGENWWFEVTPFDGTDYGAKKISAVITIKNTSPSVSNIQFNPNEPKTGIDLTVSYSYNDLDGEGEGGTIILWYRNGGIELSYTDMKTVDGAILVKGDLWNVSIKVSDGSDYSAWLNDSVLIVNTPPTIITDSAEIFESALGLITTSSLLAMWSSYDADGDSIIDYKITWENRSGGSFLEQSILANFTEVPAIYTQKNQEWRFKIQIFDGIAWSLLTNSFVSVIKNSEPIVENITLSGGQTTVDPITVAYDFYDADGDPDQSEILWGIFHLSPPFIFQSGTTVLPDSEFAAGDLVWVEITPDDDDASTGQGEPVDTSKQTGIGKQIQVGNTAPQINTTLGYPTILADHPTGTDIYTAQYSLYVNYSDFVYDIDTGEGSSIFEVSYTSNENIYYNTVNLVVGAQYRWYKFNTETSKYDLKGSLTGMIIDSYYLQRNDQWIVSVRPCDKYGYYGVWVNSTPVLIGNSLPQVLGFEWSTDYPTTSDDLSFSFDYFDYDGNPKVESQTLILWYLNGVLLQGTENYTLLSHTYFVKGDTISVIFCPSDGTNWAARNYTSTEFVGLLVIENSAPTATNVTLTPSIPYTLDVLVLNWAFNDADGDLENPNYIIEWRRSGVVIPELENLTIIPSSYTSKGETWQAHIRVFDGIDHSIIWYSSNNGDVLVIENTPMVITDIGFLGIESSTTIADKDLLIDWNTSDDDNEGQVDYEIYWYCDDGNGTYLYQSEYNTHIQIIPSTVLIKGQAWYCIVRVYDGDDWSANMTSPVISIINAAPEVSNLHFVFDPSTSQVEPDVRNDEFYVEDEIIVISYSYFDIDNDSTQTRVKWFKIIDSLILEVDTFENASSIPASALSVGDQWFCMITAYDGYSSGASYNSSIISIFSRPICESYTITPDISTEGNFIISVTVHDLSFDIANVELLTIFNDTNSESWLASNSGGENWTVMFILEDINYLNTNMSVLVTSTTRVPSTAFEIYSLFSFSLILEDKAPPRVMDAYFDWNNKRNPTNLTFEAVIQEFGSGISQVELYYYFSPAEDSEGNGASVGHISSNQVTMTFKQYNTTENYYIYEITVNFIHNNSDTDIIYWIATTDNAGNTAPLAFDIREDHQRIKEQRFVYTPPGLPQEILLIAGLMICIIFIGAVVYVKFIRKPELVGLDKELVLNNISEVSEEEVNESVDQHTLGIVISFFDQRHGPIPIIIAPELLRDNFNKLVELSDRSFSGTGFSDNFEIEIPSSYDFVLDQGIRTSILSFGFALNKPEARGGQENLTLNILVHHDMFPLVQSFQKSIQQKTHEIHLSMADEGTEKAMIRRSIIDLRKYISYIILSYKNVYGTTELIEEES